MHTQARRPLLVTAAASLLASVACSSSDRSHGSGSTAPGATTAPASTRPPGTTPRPGPVAPPLARPGPAPVALAGPGANGPHATREQSITVRSPSGHTGSMKVRSPVGAGPWPTVLILHGWGAFPALYEEYAERYASRGFAAARFSAPFTLDPPIEHWRKNATAAIDALESGNGDPSSPIFQLLDMSRFALLGHSYGGAAALGIAATDPRCKVVAALSPGTMIFYRGDFLTYTPRIACPTLIVGAEFDEVVFVKLFARPAFEKLPTTTQKLYVEIARGEHNNYCDGFDAHIMFPTPTGPESNVAGAVQRAIAADYATAWLERFLGLQPDTGGFTDGTRAALDFATGSLSKWSR